MPFAAVLLDLDGTLVDSEAVTLMAWRHAKRAMGITPDEHFLESLAGIDDVETDKRIAARYPALDVPAARKIMLTTLMEEEARNLPVKSGAFELFDHLDRLSMPRALVTSTKSARAARKLSLSGLDRRVETIVAFEQVTSPKPAAEPYRLGARLLGVDPASCLAFEDSETGVASAHAAGCTVVQIPDIGASGSEKAHHIAADLIDGARVAGLI